MLNQASNSKPPIVLFFLKSFHAAHTRTLKNGTVVQVGAYSDKRLRHDAQAVHVDHSKTQAEDKEHWARLHQEQHVLHHTDKAEHEARLKHLDGLIEHHKRQADNHEKLRDKARADGDSVALSTHNKGLTTHHNKTAKFEARHAKTSAKLAKVNEKLAGIHAAKEKLWAGSGAVALKEGNHPYYRKPKEVGKEIADDIISKITVPSQDNIMKPVTGNGWTAGRDATNKNNKEGAAHDKQKAIIAYLKDGGLLTDESLDEISYIGNKFISNVEKQRLGLANDSHSGVPYFNLTRPQKQAVNDFVTAKIERTKSAKNFQSRLAKEIARNRRLPTNEQDTTKPDTAKPKPEAEAVKPKQLDGDNPDYEEFKKWQQSKNNKPAFNKDGLGNVSKVKTAKGTEIETRFKVVDAGDLITSHDSSGHANPKFPSDLQPRDRSKQTSQAWVSTTSKNLDVDKLGKTRDAANGAPIVGKDGVVESGNGRTMAINHAYENGHADEYKAWLTEEAAGFGIDPESIKGMKNPVLVRERQTDVDRSIFTKEANEDDKMAMTATEKARSDGDKISGALVEKLHDGDLQSKDNRDFVQGFIKTLSNAEAAQYFTTSGKLTKHIYDRVQAAVFARAYDDDRLLELMVDDANPDVKNIISALNGAAGNFIQARDSSSQAHKALTSTVTDGIKVSMDKQAVNLLLDASNAILEAKNKGLSIGDYLRQNNIFGDDETPADVAEMALFISENNRSPAKLTKVFKGMADSINKQAEHSATTDLMGGMDTLDIMDIFRQAAGIAPVKSNAPEPVKPAQRTGGFVDMFTETRGQKRDREAFEAKKPAKLAKSLQSSPLILFFKAA